MAKVGVSPSYWLENINSLPIDSDNIQAVGVMLGVNNTSQTSQMKQLIDELISRYPGKTIYIQRVLPVTSNYTTINYNEMNQNISKYNSEIESYCSGKAGVKFIDTSAGYVDTSGAGVNNMFANDGLHPTNYEQLKTNIENAILNGGGGTVSGEYGLNEKQYAYLPAREKRLVDDIVDALSKDARIAALYDSWCQSRENGKL